MPATTGRLPDVRPSRLPYRPGIDGLRAVAVISVLLYHGQYAWASGGFLGVEVFFVISGYLITALLLSEVRSTGRIDLRRFWTRRALRLLPALFTVLLVSTVVAVIFFPDEVASLRGDVLASIFYVTNWNFILVEQSYFEAVGRPSLVQHLWSLAVEEQFYLLWPLVLAAGIAWLGRRRFPFVVLAMALGSVALMWVLYSPDTDPSRVYYGTDTRAAGLLLGACLAFVWQPGRLHAGVARSAHWVLDGVGLVALALMLRMLLSTDEFSSSLYRGGFLRLDILTLIVIAVAVHPGARLGSWLGVAPLRWIGLRSYGIYLWHWPVFQVTRPDLDVPLSGLPLFALRVVITLALAEASYRFIEVPARRGDWAHWWEQATAWISRRITWRPSMVLGGALALVAVVIAVPVLRAEPPPPVDYLAVGAGGVRPVSVDPPTTTTTSVAPAPTAVPGVDPAAPAPPDATAGVPGVPPDPALTTSTTAPGPIVPIDHAVTAVGDSVMLGATYALQDLGPGMTVDAAVNRQVKDGIAVLEWRRNEGYLGDTVIIHLGNNGVFNDEQFDEIMSLLEGRRVVFLTVKVPRSWEEHNNHVILEGVKRHPNALLIDWKSMVESRGPENLDDGMHVNALGAQLYAALVADLIRTLN